MTQVAQQQTAKSHNPEYSVRLLDWELCDDCYQGERRVKELSQKYLPATESMRIDGMQPGQPGRMRYDAYKLRAIFHGYFQGAVETHSGTMHDKPADIKLPKILEPMMTRATVQGESLHVLLRRINEAQLSSGRCGLLLDLQVGADGVPFPYIAFYDWKSIINWDDGAPQQPVRQTLNLVVLDESSQVREGFQWKQRDQYRVLWLGDFALNETSGVYSQGTTDKAETIPTVATQPSVRGKTLDKIPFIFVNAKDILPQPDVPPLMALANICVSLYRAEADFRNGLHSQGQDTLVLIGSRISTNPEEPTRTGAGAVIELQGEKADAKYIGIDGGGLPEQAKDIDRLHARANELSGQLHTEGTNESGEALKTRVTSRTANLKQIALTGAYALESVLKMAAEWMGGNPDEVSIKPHTDFAETQLAPADMAQIMGAKALGLPLSRESIHNKLRQKGWTEKTLQEEDAAIALEEPVTPPPGQDDEETPPADDAE